MDESLEATRSEFEADGPRQDVLGLVGLVEDGHVVFGEDRPLAGYIDPVEVEVGHHHIGEGGSGSGVLGEAVVTAGASCRSGTLGRSDADRRPGGRRRLHRQVGSVAGGSLLGPGRDSGQVLDIGRLGQPVELLLVTGGSRRQFVQPLPAQVVRASLEDRERKRTTKMWRQVLLKEGQVLCGQLVLESLGGRRHHRGTPRDDGWDEVGQRLTGARSRPDH